MKQYAYIIRATVAGSLLLAVLLLTDPLDAPLVVLMMPFVLLFALIHQITMFLLQRLLPSLSVARKNAIAIPVAFLPVALILLSSVQQLTTRDIVLLVVLLLITGFYIRRSHIFNQ